MVFYQTLKKGSVDDEKHANVFKVSKMEQKNPRNL